MSSEDDGNYNHWSKKLLGSGPHPARNPQMHNKTSMHLKQNAKNEKEISG